jgi:DNA (cytosine-5)-methyltransferase 1
VLDLFSGIGGFSLGLERAGMRTLAFCEIEPYCRAVLKKHWPNVPIFEDVTKLKGADVGSADIICGGFPCQDISLAGKGAGIQGERSGLWREYARLISEIRPKYAIIENVPALRGRGLSRVLCDLAALGYDAEWHCIPASAIGARHRRDRIWIVAYSNLPGYSQAGLREADSRRQADWSSGTRSAASDSLRQRYGVDSQQPFMEADRRRILTKDALRERANGWLPEPALGRVVDGFPGRVDQIRALGNAIVPQIAEIIGRAIIDFEQNRLTQLVA